MSSNTAIDTGTFNPQRVVADLRELASRTGGPEGSRRLCWTPEWVNARNLLREELSSLPVDVDVDEAGTSGLTFVELRKTRWSLAATSTASPRVAGSTAPSAFWPALNYCAHSPLRARLQ